MAARWGSLFQQAVTGLEARLDTILADEEEKAKASQAQATSGAAGATTAAAASSTPAPTLTPTSAKSSPSLSRSGSTNRTQDRLQERLARAVAAKNASGGSRPAEPSPSRNSFTSSPRQSLDVPSRASIDGGESVGKSAQDPASRRASHETSNRPSLDATETDPAPDSQARAVAVAAAREEKPVGQENTCDAPRESTDSGPSTTPIAASATAADVSGAEPLSTAESETLIGLGKQQDIASDDLQRQHQDEIHHYVEKIDALQAKLQYLAREAADAAKKTAQAAPSGSLEKKLAEKDHQIALLMEEGKSLGVTEQKHRTIMKKLRAKIAEDEKEINNLKASVAKADAEAEAQRRQGRRAKDLEKFHEESLKRIGQLQKDINNLRTESSSKDSTIADLKAQLEQANENAESLNAKANQAALEKERRRVKELEDEVATLKVEKELAADRARAQANELKEKAERATERARVVEAELKAEAQALESKLEAMRTRAEETTSGALGDSQAKLLRQVETLQTQYAIASDNWQGIEATLLGRISNLEKERDEAQQRESDMRKKAREAVRAKRHEEELEEARSKLPTAQQDIESYQKQLEALKKRAEQAEATLQEARADFDKQNAAWKEERRQGTGSVDRSAPDERRGWLEDMAQQQPFRSNSRPESPLLLPPTRTWSTDMLGLQALTGKLRKPSAPSSNGDGVGDRGRPRRPSAQRSHRPSMTPSLTSSHHHLTPASTFSASVESLPAPGTHPMDQEDMEGVETGSTHQVVQDMVSVSTRVAKLEAEVAEVNARYETTLEMLGEKSEMVEELKADVQDVKAMYRDLIERTLK
ncbi:M protein repeat protein [Magnaporthiopsis poae ATCC 64411]|uniref:M protein repeat protein n=1 Tax=Magnaporthiopsis poae (strain ATCC 64411 / 73-15) TaxID=644358 RepID=A0A0C4E704_MAGP6|nr:M protein repeat protein [Magnaporthiopsis poae ATCC 64411]